MPPAFRFCCFRCYASCDRLPLPLHADCCTPFYLLLVRHYGRFARLFHACYARFSFAADALCFFFLFAELMPISLFRMMARRHAIFASLIAILISPLMPQADISPLSFVISPLFSLLFARAADAFFPRCRQILAPAFRRFRLPAAAAGHFAARAPADKPFHAASLLMIFPPFRFSFFADAMPERLIAVSFLAAQAAAS